MGTSGEVPPSVTPPQRRRRFLLEARDLEPSWSRTLIALLLGLDLFDDAADEKDVVDAGSVPDVPPPPAGHARVWKLKDCTSAAVECASIHDFLNALAHDGLEVPCTHAYKHRRVTPVVRVPDAERLPLHTLSPSLEMQLAPLPTPELERRLAAAERRDTSEEGDARDAKRARLAATPETKKPRIDAKSRATCGSVASSLRRCDSNDRREISTACGWTQKARRTPGSYSTRFAPSTVGPKTRKNAKASAPRRTPSSSERTSTK
jgi:hypothetical protein